MTDPSANPQPPEPNPLSIREKIADWVETYTITGILSGLRHYTQTKATLLQAVDSDRAHQWVGLTRLLDNALTIATRIESEDERHL